MTSRRVTIYFIVFLSVILIFICFSQKLKKSYDLFNEKKILLLWTTFYGSHSNWQKFFFKSREIQLGCSNCIFTTNRSLLNQSDAIFFHAFHTNLNFSDLPLHRKPNQRWVLVLNEPPAIPFKNFTMYNNMFNWTMSYRKDSDIFGGYGDIQIVPDNNSNPQTKNFALGKTKLVSWFVSHCKTNGRRENYVQELSKYIPVDIYGKCGNGSLKCSRANIQKCHKIIDKNYKFYLSFENSLCKDYVTEKFYDILLLNVVPVIFNSGNEEDLIPMSGYIDSRSFSTPQLLAEYLIKVSQNDTLYNTFFDWKRGKRIRNNVYYKVACNLCEKLYDFLPVKMYNDLNNWWNEKSACHYWKQNELFYYVNM